MPNCQTISASPSMVQSHSDSELTCPECGTVFCQDCSSFNQPYQRLECPWCECNILDNMSPDDIDELYSDEDETA